MKNKENVAYELGFEGPQNEAEKYFNSFINELKELNKNGIIPDSWCNYITRKYFIFFKIKEIDAQSIISKLKDLNHEEIYSLFSWEFTYSMKKFIKFIINTYNSNKCGNNCNLETISGEALTLAITMGNKEVVKMLLNLGADPNFSNGWSEPPIKLAIKKGFHEIARLLQYYCNNTNNIIAYII